MVNCGNQCGGNENGWKFIRQTVLSDWVPVKENKNMTYIKETIYGKLEPLNDQNIGGQIPMKGDIVNKRMSTKDDSAKPTIPKRKKWRTPLDTTNRVNPHPVKQPALGKQRLIYQHTYPHMGRLQQETPGLEANNTNKKALRNTNKAAQSWPSKSKGVNIKTHAQTKRLLTGTNHANAWRPNAQLKGNHIKQRTRQPVGQFKHPYHNRRGPNRQRTWPARVTNGGFYRHTSPHKTHRYDQANKSYHTMRHPGKGDIWGQGQHWVSVKETVSDTFNNIIHENNQYNGPPTTNTRSDQTKTYPAKHMGTGGNHWTARLHNSKPKGVSSFYVKNDNHFWKNKERPRRNSIKFPTLGNQNKQYHQQPNINTQMHLNHFPLQNQGFSQFGGNNNMFKQKHWNAKSQTYVQGNGDSLFKAGTHVNYPVMSYPHDHKRHKATFIFGNKKMLDQIVGPAFLPDLKIYPDLVPVINPVIPGPIPVTINPGNTILP